ncbi:hypothetical protein KXQ82_13170 [Mucilaginibacter sp. HMF5004]|uniref:hypothetical protein n=1 Tax=Mucilaginibacter rivuli TaxID=2857527 RepID=UPI001C5F3F2D|nr:hypothetical protein [Mucilaginibacter rivuli]MBW4890680.1 hypothetical protein [Mucilaginibacter rivuli]
MEIKDIKAHADSISLNQAALNSNRLCEIWPTVKEGLQLLQGAITNPFVKASIGVLIATGEAIMSRICPALGAKTATATKK